MKQIKIIPLDIDKWLELSRLKESLSRIYGTEVHLEEPRPLPEQPFSPKRNQYNASELVLHYRDLRDPEFYLLFITIEDLYAGCLNFIFGLAHGKMDLAVISLARLSSDPEHELKQASELFFQRMEKEAVHEIGHLTELSHCSNPECVMHFSNSLSDTDRKSSQFCRECLHRLERI